MCHENMEDRLIVMQRISDLVIYFEQLNNFQGVQEAKAALLSTPVFRLVDTYDVSFLKWIFSSFFQYNQFYYIYLFYS